MKKLIIAPAFLALIGCGSASNPSEEVGFHIKSDQPADYILTCEEIAAEVTDLNLDVRLSGKSESGDATYKSESWIRDAVARIKALHRMQVKKDCVKNAQAGQQESPTNLQPVPQAVQQPVLQPAPKEKSRVIICNNDQSCVVE